MSTPGQDVDFASSSYPDPLDSLRESLSGRFEIGAEAGRGGMAVVYRGNDVKHHRPVALKILRPELASVVGAERFMREISIEARLNHPNILTLIDSGQSGDVLYYLTPWADGGTLRDRLNIELQLPLDAALTIVREVGDALSHAHRLGIVHRDVKPENILFRGGHALLADFGIAHAIADTGQGSLTETGLALGTPKYMSPEQATPGAKVDARADQYALACILYEMLSGDPPFTGRTTHIVLTRHLTEPPPSLAAVRPDLPSGVVSAVNRALQKSPAARFASVDEFLAALAAPQPRQRVSVSTRRAATVALVVVALAALLLTATRGSDVPLARNKVAVFPLAALGLPAADSTVGAGVAYLLEAALEQANPLQLIDVAGRLNDSQRRAPQTISDRAADRIATQVGAGFSLLGVVLGRPDSTTVILRLFSVAGDTLVRQSSVTGPSRTPIHHLGIDALKPLLSALIDPERVVDLAPLRDRRAQSIALWMQGERHYRLSQFDSASRLYERALADDSLLAQAAIKGGQSAYWLHDLPKARTLVRHALTLESRLPPKYARLARGLDAQFDGQPDSALRRLAEAQALDPQWAEPSAAMGEVYTHYLPSAGPLDSLARTAFEQGMQRDSGFTSPLFHLAEDAIRESRLPDADRLIARLRDARAEAVLVRQLLLMRACVGRPERMLWRVASKDDAFDVFNAAKSLSAGARHPVCAETGFRALLQSSHASDAERWAAFLGLHGHAVARRDDALATALIDSIVSSGRGAVRTAYVLDAIAGARTAAEADSLVAWAHTRYGVHYEKNTNPEALWVLLSWHRERGDTALVRIVADTLNARATASQDQRALMYANAARAQARLSAGDTSGAMDDLRKLPFPGGGGDLAWAFGDALPVERLLLARLLLARRQYRESFVVASAFDHPQPMTFLPFVGESLGIRYRAALALGNRRAADSLRRRLILLGRLDLINAADTGR